jgi:hypothetical protein
MQPYWTLRRSESCGGYGEFLWPQAPPRSRLPGMRKPPAKTPGTLPMLPPLPGWIVSAAADTLEAAALA